MKPKIDPEDELICLGHGEDLAAQMGAMAPPVVQTSLFAFPSHGELMDGLRTESRNHVYSRGQNPTVESVEEKIAALERGERAKLFASGMSAISSVLYGLLKSGDHVLFVNQTYGPTMQLAEYMRRFGVEHDLLLDVDIDSVRQAIRPETRMIWLESPGTMTFLTLDIAAITALAKEREILTVHDNSWATPLFQKPLTLGVDIVVHSATKYIGGHSDVVAGAVVANEELLETVFYNAFLLNGGALGPWDAWLLNRGLRTMPVRIRQHHADGLAVARYLAEHPRVRHVHHPGLDDEDDNSTLSGYSGLFSFELDSDNYEDVKRVVNGLTRFRIGVSWGGVESLVIAPNRGDNAEALRAKRVAPGLIRLSVGLEGAQILIADLRSALDI